MLSFDKQYTIPSKVAAGVSFTVRRLSLIERANRDLESAESLDKLDDLRRQFELLPQDAKHDTADQAALRIQIDNQYMRILHAKVFPVVIRAGLLAVDGFDGSVDDLLQCGDSDLLNEAYTYCEAAAKLTAEQLKNLASPGISDAAVAGQSETSNAATASEAA